MNIKDLYKKITGIEYPNYKKYIEIEVSGDLDDGSDTLLPSVVLKLEWLMISFYIILIFYYFSLNYFLFIYL